MLRKIFIKVPSHSSLEKELLRIRGRLINFSWKASENIPKYYRLIQGELHKNKKK
jgi:hypothetical protein